MGLSNVASGGIILVVLVVVLMTMPGLLDSTLTLQEASSANSDIQNSISKTIINVNTLTAPTGNPDEITFSVDNTGEEKLWNFEKFNVIITYDSASSKHTEALLYGGTCGGGQATVGTWCINSITDDRLDPDILNEGESLEIKSTVANNLSTGIAIVVIVTDNGVVATDSVSVP